MRLSAIYIPKNSLQHIFGPNHDGKTLNLGGANTYEFTENNINIELTKSILNPSFIKSFWSDNISLISSIVGKNGTGKTSILRACNIPPDPEHRNLIFVFEIDDQIQIINETDKNLVTNPEYIQTNLRKFEVQYYSPVLDYDLKDTFSSIALIKYHTNTIDNYYFDSIVRNVILLNDPIINSIKTVYPDFPSYEKYFIRTTQHRKTHFRSTYLEANFGNPNRGDVLKNYLEGDLMRIEDDESKNSFSKKEVLNIYNQSISLLKSESFTELFNKIWEIEDYNFKSEKDFIHGSDDFIKNFEITILSYLLLGAVFPKHGLAGEFDFDKILNAKNFNERLNNFLEFYLVNEDESLTEKIKTDLKEINVIQKDRILLIINQDKQKSYQGIDLSSIKERMKKDVIKISSIYDMYEYLLKIISEKKVAIRDGFIEFNIVKEDINTYIEFVENYQNLLSNFTNSVVQVSIFDFIPNKKLSTGEKSILDFYASLNTYINKIKNREHLSHPYILLLLDEPELGYHPIWKKKFINAIDKTLPILFSKITPKTLNPDTKEYEKTKIEYPIIQIILCTHDPLTLSDLPSDKVIYLDKNDINNFTTINNSQIQSFAANITDLLANSFFITDGLIGEFAKEKIQEIIDVLIDKSMLDEIPWLEAKEDIKKIIDLIGEPLLREKLSEMYFMKYPDSKNEEIEHLRQRLKDLENGSNNN